MTPHKFPFSIAYADTDAGGITYHARYIEIAERARMNWKLGDLPPETVEEGGFVVRELSAKYIRPLRLGDEFVVESQIIKMGAASMVIEQKFVKDSEIYAIIRVTAAYIGAGGRPTRIPDGWEKLYQI